MGKKNNKEALRAIVNKAAAQLRQDPDSFLQLESYNDAKNWMRRCQTKASGRFVDNGQTFLNIMTRSLQQVGNGALSRKFASLQARQRAAKALSKRTTRVAMATATVRPNAPNQQTTRNETISAVAAAFEQHPTQPNDSRIDVFYGRTDNTPGDKEYTCVVVKTSERESLRYNDDLYCPARGCQYKILNELPMSKLADLCNMAPAVSVPSLVGFVSFPLKERVLEYCKNNEAASRSGFNYSLVPFAMR